MKNESEAFKAFWEIWRPYRRHTDGRGKARVAFEKAVSEGADPETIIEGAGVYFDYVLPKAEKENNGKRSVFEFIPLAATWLNDGRFEDVLEDWEDHLREEEKREELKRRRDNVAQFPRGQTKFLKQFAENG